MSFGVSLTRLPSSSMIFICETSPVGVWLRTESATSLSIWSFIDKLGIMGLLSLICYVMVDAFDAMLKQICICFLSYVKIFFCPLLGFSNGVLRTITPPWTGFCTPWLKPNVVENLLSGRPKPSYLALWSASSSRVGLKVLKCYCSRASSSLTSSIGPTTSFSMGFTYSAS